MTARNGKKFDCVEMKRSIQDRIAGEVAQLDAEARRRRMDDLASGNARIERLWKRPRRSSDAA